MKRKMSELSFVKTCDACPEQYNVYNRKGHIVAYLRLRWGEFTVECPDVGGDLVYCDNPAGYGNFTADERPLYLDSAAEAIISYYNKSSKRPWCKLCQWVLQIFTKR